MSSTASGSALSLPQRWLCPEGYVYFRQDVADAPCKDYFQLIVTCDLNVSFRVWKLLPPFRPPEQLAPKAYFSTREEFRTDVPIRDAIQTRLRGELEYLDNLLDGRYNFLERLDRDIQLLIVSFLDVCSVLRLAATSKHFRELCSDNSVWKRHYMASSLRFYVTPGLMDTVDQQGWKAFYIIMRRIASSTDEIGAKVLLQKPPSSYLHIKDLSEISGRRESLRDFSKLSL